MVIEADPFISGCIKQFNTISSRPSGKRNYTFCCEPGLTYRQFEYANGNHELFDDLNTIIPIIVSLTAAEAIWSTVD